jgi:hypothetical protein
MKIKQPGPAMDLGETGDPFLRPGTVISDAPDPSAVNRDIEQMDRHFDHLGSGAYDQRHEAERAMRDQIVVGNYEHPEDMFAHGAAMPVRMEDAVRYSSGSQREAVAEQAAAADELLADYRALYGSEAANDSAGLHAAIQYVNRQLHRDGRLIGDFITENRSEYLRDIWYAHQAGYGTDRYPSYDDDTGRTSGISAGAPAARGTTQEQDKGDLVEELRALQRVRGW